MHRGMDWLRLKAGGEGLTMGLGGGDVSKEENKGQEGLTSEKLETEPLGLRFVHVVRNGIGGDGRSC